MNKKNMRQLSFTKLRHPIHFSLVLLLTVMFIGSTYLFNQIPLVDAVTYPGNYNGTLNSNNNTVQGDVLGGLTGNYNVIWGSVTGKISGSNNEVRKNAGSIGNGYNNSVEGNILYGISGYDNVVWGDAVNGVGGDRNAICNNESGLLNGNNNTIWGSLTGSNTGAGNSINNIVGGQGPCTRTTPPTPPTPNPTPTPTPTATPLGNIINLNFGNSNTPLTGNIINLNFGISNAFPWMQVVCGDMRIDNGVTNPLPTGQTTSTTNPSCASPGIIFTGDTTASFGQGQASSTNQVVGGSTYPEVYTSPGSQGIFSAYSYLAAKATGNSGGITDLATICTLSNCTLPPNLPHGVYEANGDVTLNTYTFPANQNYVFLIHGNLTLNGNVLTPAGTNSSTLFSASGNIIIPATVGSAATTTTANLSGLFSTDKSFIMQSSGNCSDLRLNIEGSLIVNAGLTGGTLQNNRDLCGNDTTFPTLQLTQRLDYVLNLPDFVKEQSVTSSEVAP